MSLMESLLRLNQVDAQVRGLRSRLDSAKKYLNGQIRQVDALTAQKNEVLSRRRQLQATIANLEVETAAMDERLEKLRNELNSAETNKQYAAILSELTVVKENRVGVEDRILDEMTTVEALGVELEALVEKIADREKVRELAAEQLRDREEEISARLAELESERSQAAASVPQSALAVFDEMVEICDGEPMAELEEINRRHRDYACGACHMTVPFEHVSVLLSGGNTLVRCTACSRILYMQEETKGALAKK